jgi:hypothetical protein
MTTCCDGCQCPCNADAVSHGIVEVSMTPHRIFSYTSTKDEHHWNEWRVEIP